MRRFSGKISIFAVTMAVGFLGMCSTSHAAGISSVISGVGVSISLTGESDPVTTQTKEITDSTVSSVDAGTAMQAYAEGAADSGFVAAAQDTVPEDVTETADEIVEDVEDDEESLLSSLVIAQVTNYVNVRDLPSEEDGEVIGKLYNNSVGTFIEEEDGWYKISSGSVTGYVKGEYCVTGEDAVDLARDVSTRIATVNTTTLKVREEADAESACLTLIPYMDELVVVEETDDWVKVDTEDGYGWVSAEYVDLSREFVQAESKEEEEARLAKEEAERKAALEAAQASQKKSSSSSSSSGSSSSSSATVSGSGSAMGKAVAEYALQFVGNPYVYGGSSLTNGTDCSGFVMSVYAHFGVSLPHSSSADRSVGTSVNGLSNAQPGDIICYSGHVGIYIGNGQIVHASTSRTGIIVSNANYKSILSIRRIF